MERLCSLEPAAGARARAASRTGNALEREAFGAGGECVRSNRSCLLQSSPWDPKAVGRGRTRRARGRGYCSPRWHVRTAAIARMAVRVGVKFVRRRRRVYVVAMIVVQRPHGLLPRVLERRWQGVPSLSDGIDAYRGCRDTIRTVEGWDGEPECALFWAEICCSEGGSHKEGGREFHKGGNEQRAGGDYLESSRASTKRPGARRIGEEGERSRWN
ncbi:hypothetical protein K438DRAFT_1753593 [Mycena galopus ATCC 62051]|nr:hypothetical protein K438DRAFT_1753593 [Mycena galopus ATCC 62051]